MDANPIAPLMVCGTCGQKLNSYELYDDEGHLDKIIHEHAAVLPRGVAPHDALPVPLRPDHATVGAVCDFCSDIDGAWAYPADPFDSPVGLQVINPEGATTHADRFTGDWTACEACHKDIEADRYEEIAVRATVDLPPAVRRETLRGVLAIHLAFRSNRTGAPVPIASKETS